MIKNASVKKIITEWKKWIESCAGLGIFMYNKQTTVSANIFIKYQRLTNRLTASYLVVSKPQSNVNVFEFCKE